MGFRALGVVVGILSAWLGDYALTFVKRMPRYEVFGDEFGPRLFRTVFIAAPFFLTAAWIDRRTRTRGRPAITASRVAQGVVLTASIALQVSIFLLPLRRWYGPTGASLWAGFAIMTSWVWLTALAIGAFAITDDIVSNRRA